MSVSNFSSKDFSKSPYDSYFAAALTEGALEYLELGGNVPEEEEALENLDVGGSEAPGDLNLLPLLATEPALT